MILETRSLTDFNFVAFSLKEISLGQEISLNKDSNETPWAVTFILAVLL